MRRSGEREVRFRDRQRLDVSNIVAHQIEENNRKQNPPQPGIKSTVLNVYAKSGEQAAWEALQEYNKKLSGDGFTLEMLEQWIGEYHAKQPNRGMGKDDGSYR